MSKTTSMNFKKGHTHSRMDDHMGCSKHSDDHRQVAVRSFQTKAPNRRIRILVPVDLGDQVHAAIGIKENI
jgi:hypothetical protein